MTLHLCASSQTSDRIPIPRDAAQRVLIAAQQKQLCDSLVLTYIEEVAVQERRITNLNQQIKILKENDLRHQEINSTLRQEIELYQKNYKIQGKELRKMKLGKKLTAGAGILLVVGTILLLK